MLFAPKCYNILSGGLVEVLHNDKKLDMSVIFAMDDHRVGVIHQRAPTEDGDSNFTLQGACKGWEAGTFQDHRAHFRVLLVEIYCHSEEF